MLRLRSCVFALVGAGAVCGAAWGEEPGFRSLFDGRTLAGWDGAPGFWRVEDGAITGQTTPERPAPHNTFLIWRGGELDDFELRLEYRIHNHNSGVQYRSREEPDWIVVGYQADASFETPESPWSGILYEEGGRGFLAKRGEKAVIGLDGKPKVTGSVGDPEKLGAVVKNGQWNELVVTAQGNHLVHKINGQVTIDVVDEDAPRRRASGVLALQLHQGTPMKVQFRNIRLKRLPLKDAKKIVFLAGPKSHGPGEHDHAAGCLLLAECLNRSVPGVRAVVYRSADGWPEDPSALDNADAVVVYADGEAGHPFLGHMDEVGALMERGAGLVALHWATGVPNDPPAERFREWLGGVFEPFWSVNPHWKADFATLPDHAITRGVKPFSLQDEWYYNVRFLEGRRGVTPILVAIPPDATRTGPDGKYSGNAHVRSRRGKPECLAWVRVRPGGGRSFGLTGGHWHANWAVDDFRKLVLNGIVWTAGLDVPADGVASPRPEIESVVPK